MYFPCVYERIVVPLQHRKTVFFILSKKFYNKALACESRCFFVCMKKFLYLCIANKVEKAFFMVL